MNRFVPKEYETTREKQIDFALGVVILLVANAVMAGGFIALTSASVAIDQSTNPVLYTLVSIGVATCAIGPFVINIAGIILLAIYRRWMAFGMLATIGALMVLVMCAGIVLIGTCGAGLMNI